MKPHPNTIDTGNAPHFDGTTYDPEQDHKRLTGQLKRVFDVMKAGEWLPLWRITARVQPGTESSVSARLRDLRKAKFGGHTVERRRVKAGRGMYEYKLTVKGGAE